MRQRVRYKPGVTTEFVPVDGIIEFSPPGTLMNQRRWEAHLIVRSKGKYGQVKESKYHAELHDGVWYGSRMKYACERQQVELIERLWELYISDLTLNDSASNIIEIEIEQ